MQKINTNLEYVVEDAAKVVEELILEELSNKLSYEDIIEILEMEFKWQQKSGLTKEKPLLDIELPPIDIDEDSMNYFIIHECVKKDIILTYDELDEILDAEDEYLRKVGIIDDSDESYQMWAN